MSNRFKIVLFLLPAAVLLIILPATLRSASPVLLPICGQAMVAGSDLTITKTSSTSVDLSWRFESLSAYTVTVTDLTTSTLERSFTTGNRYATVSGLTAGHLYRFVVGSNGYVIVDDLIIG